MAAGGLTNDVAAVIAALVDADETTPLANGLSMRANLDALMKGITDHKRLAKEIEAKLPAGAAKTAMADVILNYV